MRMDEGDPLSELRSLVGSCLREYSLEDAGRISDMRELEFPTCVNIQ